MSCVNTTPVPVQQSNHSPVIFLLQLKIWSFFYANWPHSNLSFSYRYYFFSWSFQRRLLYFFKKKSSTANSICGIPTPAQHILLSASRTVLPPHGSCIYHYSFFIITSVFLLFTCSLNKKLLKIWFFPRKFFVFQAWTVWKWVSQLTGPPSQGGSPENALSTSRRRACHRRLRKSAPTSQPSRHIKRHPLLCFGPYSRTAHYLQYLVLLLMCHSFNIC